MLRRVDWRQLLAARRNERSFLPSVIIGLGIWIGFPTVAAFQDMQSLVSGFRRVERALELVRGNSGRRLDARRRNAVRRCRHHDRLDLGRRHGGARHRRRRAARQGHRRRRDAGRGPHRARRQAGPLAKVLPVAPPKAFNAGSVFKRTSMLVAFDARQEDEDGLRQPRRSKARKSRSPPRSTCARTRSPIRCCRR